MALHVFLFLFQVQQNRKKSACLHRTELSTSLTFTSLCQGARCGKRGRIKRRLNLLLQFYQEAVAHEKTQRGRLKIKGVRNLCAFGVRPALLPVSNSGASSYLLYGQLLQFGQRAGEQSHQEGGRAAHNVDHG